MVLSHLFTPVTTPQSQRCAAEGCDHPRTRGQPAPAARGESRTPKHPKLPHRNIVISPIAVQYRTIMRKLRKKNKGAVKNPPNFSCQFVAIEIGFLFFEPCRIFQDISATAFLTGAHGTFWNWHVMLRRGIPLLLHVA